MTAKPLEIHDELLISREFLENPYPMLHQLREEGRGRSHQPWRVTESGSHARGGWARLRQRARILCDLIDLTKAYFEAHDNSGARRAAAHVSSLADFISPSACFSPKTDNTRWLPKNMARCLYLSGILQPIWTSAWFTLNSGNSKDARNAYQSALELNASSPEPYLHLGLDAAASGKNAQAINWLGQALAEAPGSEISRMPMPKH
jgi:tetratricopeptide (TPR) repeat protein